MHTHHELVISLFSIAIGVFSGRTDIIIIRIYSFLRHHFKCDYTVTLRKPLGYSCQNFQLGQRSRLKILFLRYVNCDLGQITIIQPSVTYLSGSLCEKFWKDVENGGVCMLSRISKRKSYTCLNGLATNFQTYAFHLFVALQLAFWNIRNVQ